MRLARFGFRRRLTLRQHVKETGSGSTGGARGGMPLFLAGGSRSHTHNFGSVSASFDERGEIDNSEIAPDETEEELAVVSGEGVTTQVAAYGLALRGRTDATFSNNFSTEDGQARPATGCTECSGSECIQAMGTLVSTFQVATTVTLPSVDDFPGLTPCQRQRVQSGITNVLAPHEQQHVAAFQTYNGTVRTSFNLKLCRDAFDARIQSLHDGIAASRQASAQARSDALDPFNFEVDLNCQDTPGSSATTSTGQQSASVTGEETEHTGTDVG